MSLVRTLNINKFIHGILIATISEGDLTLLEQEWEKVQHQTLWSLQNCFMSPNNDNGHDAHPPSLFPQESTLPSATDSSSTPPPSLQDHQTRNGSSNPGLGPSMQSSNPSTPTNVARGEESFLDDHRHQEGEDTPGPVSEDVNTSEDPSFLDPTPDPTSAT